MLKVAAAVYTAVIAMITSNSDTILSNDVTIHDSDSIVIFIFKIIVDEFSDL